MANNKNPDRVTKDFMIRVRVTSAEREMFMKQSKEKGYRTVSDYIRSLLDDESEQKHSAVS